MKWNFGLVLEIRNLFIARSQKETFIWYFSIQASLHFFAVYHCYTAMPIFNTRTLNFSSTNASSQQSGSIHAICLCRQTKFVSLEPQGAWKVACWTTGYGRITDECNYRTNSAVLVVFNTLMVWIFLVVVGKKKLLSLHVHLWRRFASSVGLILCGVEIFEISVWIAEHLDQRNEIEQKR